MKSRFLSARFGEGIWQKKARPLIYNLFMFAKWLKEPFVVGVTGAIFDAQGRVALVKHSYQAGWHLPSGGVGRGEAVGDALKREMQEEIGLSGGTAEIFAVYTRKSGWVTNLIALFRVTGGTVNFRPSLEIREICFADPSSPPDGCTAGTFRRLEELTGATSPTSYW